MHWEGGWLPSMHWNWESGRYASYWNAFLFVNISITTFGLCEESLNGRDPGYQDPDERHLLPLLQWQNFENFFFLIYDLKCDISGGSRTSQRGGASPSEGGANLMGVLDSAAFLTS